MVGGGGGSMCQPDDHDRVDDDIYGSFDVDTDDGDINDHIDENDKGDAEGVDD